MTVDLTKLKAGDTVDLRCGGKCIVHVVESGGLKPFTHRVGLDECSAHSYKENGDWGYSPTILDIIAIHPAPEPKSAVEEWLDRSDRFIKPSDYSGETGYLVTNTCLRNFANAIKQDILAAVKKEGGK